MLIGNIETCVVMLGKRDDIIKLVKGAVKAGYGYLPAVWAIRLYLSRN